MKPSFSDLTPEQQATFGNGCGLYSRIFKLPQFIFKASCRQHDAYYTIGGWFGDKFYADWHFFIIMLTDAKDSARPVFYSLMAFLYFLAVSVFGVFAFHWSTRYRTLDEILAYDALKKEVNGVV